MYELFFWINLFHATGPHGVISGPYFPVFSPNTGKYGPETIPYLDTFHATGLFLDPLKTSFLFLRSIQKDQWHEIG